MFRGCIIASSALPLPSDSHFVFDRELTPFLCAQECGARSYALMTLTEGESCRCTDSTRLMNAFSLAAGAGGAIEVKAAAKTTAANATSASRPAASTAVPASPSAAPASPSASPAPSSSASADAPVPSSSPSSSPFAPPVLDDVPVLHTKTRVCELLPCSGDRTTACGGRSALSVYSLSTFAVVKNAPPPPKHSVGPALVSSTPLIAVVLGTCRGRMQSVATTIHMNVSKRSSNVHHTPDFLWSNTFSSIFCFALDHNVWNCLNFLFFFFVYSLSHLRHQSRSTRPHTWCAPPCRRDRMSTTS